MFSLLYRTPETAPPKSYSHCNYADLCYCQRQVRWPIDKRVADDPHAKANLLIQAHLSALTLPISDYITDTKTVLDNSIRILQARCCRYEEACCYGVTLPSTWMHTLALESLPQASSQS